MASCNENIIKNMASEVARNCQQYNINVEVEFVVYLIELLLLNPKYGHLFAKTIKRNNLEFFVNECVALIKRGETSLNTLKMQFIILMNYDIPQSLINKHLESIESCLRPLFEEILDMYPEVDDEAGLKKLYRKISVYIILCSGLGNPALIMNLKEGMAALESVLSINELAVFTALLREEKISRLEELVEIVSGVRLFNRDCMKGGEMIPDLPFDLVDAGKACLSSISHSLIAVMQRVNALTSAIDGYVQIQEETGNVYIETSADPDITPESFNQVFDLLIFNRQYEMFIRCLLGDISWVIDTSSDQVDYAKVSLEAIHAAVKYKSAVPVATVFPLFIKLWRVWREMQNIMFLVSTINRLMGILAGIQEHMKIPYALLDKLLKGKPVITDQERMATRASVEERLSLGSLDNYVTRNTSFSTIDMKDRHVEFLGFCALCLTVGALVPSNLTLGLIKHKKKKYGFCNARMAAKFSKDPARYVNEVLDYARNHPNLISLLNIWREVDDLKDIATLKVAYWPKIKVSEREVQTETHPMEDHIEKNYTSDLWEWKRRACQWANIVRCQTHSTQTHYSHMRSEIHCQTTEPRDKCLQTKKDQGMNTSVCNQFIWGLRGHMGDKAHSLDMVPKHSPEKLKPESVWVCRWPCVGVGSVAARGEQGSSSTSYDSDVSDRDFYNPTHHHRHS